MSRFRQESQRLAEDLRSLKESLSPGLRETDPSSTSANQAAAHILIDMLRAATHDSAKQMQARVEDAVCRLESDLNEKVDAQLAGERKQLQKLLTEAEIQNKLSMKVEDFIKKTSEEVDVIRRQYEDELQSEKRRIEREYRDKFDDYRKSIDIYVGEICDRFESKSAETRNLFEALAAAVPAESPRVSENCFKYEKSPRNHFCDEHLHANAEKLRKLWDITDPSKEEILNFLASVEKTLFLGHSVSTLYENAIAVEVDRLPIIQLKAKIDFVHAQGGNTDQLKDALELLTLQWHDKYGLQLNS